jgi:hypothetical protein
MSQYFFGGCIDEVDSIFKSDGKTMDEPMTILIKKSIR